MLNDSPVPCGKAWARWMPDIGFKAFGRRISLNPDRNFNQKEHMLATIMANTGFSTPYTSNIILTQFLPQYCTLPVFLWRVGA